MVVSVEIVVSRLSCCVVLSVDTDVSGEHAASGFRVEICRFRDRLAYTAK
jgi:hypothetical protein